MKKAFLGLLLVVAWLASFPAYATTYTYDVDYTFPQRRQFGLDHRLHHDVLRFMRF